MNVGSSEVVRKTNTESKFDQYSDPQGDNLQHFEIYTAR
jgi:hypothetical protein